MTIRIEHDPVLEVTELSMPWPGQDPFLFTVHHVDEYPPGNDLQGPGVPLIDRNLGADFSYVNGWSMYHGTTVPGFPRHPHRGFETVTVVRRGFVDHSDSLGATARYGEGDVQWLTTGSGIMHAEMFPLTRPDHRNPMELFQIWLNLPPESKMVAPYFGMLWSEEIPTIQAAPGVEVDVIAGDVDGSRPPPPPPDSWGSRAGTEFGIWLVRMNEGARWTLPTASPLANRTLYCFEGLEVKVASTTIAADMAAVLRPESPTVIVNGAGRAAFMILQGRPIGAPVFQMGPFVMNSAEEIQQAVLDYRRTQFGGWPWSRPDPVHERSTGRFAVHADGRVEHRDVPEAAATQFLP
jgi:quercetin 2,3-dioxygenase